MTYMVDGRQYIALTVRGKPRLLPFALPKQWPEASRKPRLLRRVRARNARR